MNMKKRNVKNALAAFFSATLVVLAAFALVSCDNELDVQQEYPFTVETMPVPTRIVKGETVEVRCKLKREGRFSDARFRSPPAATFLSYPCIRNIKRTQFSRNTAAVLLQRKTKQA